MLGITKNKGTVHANTFCPFRNSFDAGILKEQLSLLYLIIFANASERTCISENAEFVRSRRGIRDRIETLRRFLLSLCSLRTRTHKHRARLAL